MSRRPERRRDSRLEVLKRIRVESTAQHVAVTLLNIGLGGCLLQSPVDLPVESLQEFRLAMTEEHSLVLQARVVHSLRISGADAVSFAIGVQFARDPATRRTVGELMEMVDALESFVRESRAS